MKFKNKLLIGFLVALVFGTLFVLFVIHLMNQTETEDQDQDKFKKFIHDDKDTTDEERAIHRQAGVSEYWARHDMDRSLYA